MSNGKGGMTMDADSLHPLKYQGKISTCFASSYHMKVQ